MLRFPGSGTHARFPKVLPRSEPKSTESDRKVVKSGTFRSLFDQTGVTGSRNPLSLGSELSRFWESDILAKSDCFEQKSDRFVSRPELLFDCKAFGWHFLSEISTFRAKFTTFELNLPLFEQNGCHGFSNVPCGRFKLWPELRKRQKCHFWAQMSRKVPLLELLKSFMYAHLEVWKVTLFGPESVEKWQKCHFSVKRASPGWESASL